VITTLATKESVARDVVVSTDQRRTSFTVALWFCRVGLIAQLAWLMTFSRIQWQRGALGFDFSVWNQARWMIIHGHLNPLTPFFGSIPFWQINGTWMMWPLAQLTRVRPHGLILLWFQDLAIFGCAWIALHWVAEAAAGTSGRHRQWRLNYRWRSRLSPAAAVLLATVLLVADPWVYTSAAFDFHWEEPAAFFMMLIAWDLYRGRTKRVWLWVPLVLATSGVSSLYVIGAGLAGLLAGSKVARRTSALVIGAGFAWIGLMTLIHANRGSFLNQAYGYLAGPRAVNPTLGEMAKGAIFHPSRPFGELWGNRVNFWANLSPSGLLGVATPLGLAAVLTVLLPGALWSGHIMAAPSFQNFPAYPLVVVGSVLVLGRLGGRRAWVAHAARLLALAMAGLAVAWAWAWLPIYPHSWLAVTPEGGRALAAARAMIPTGAEVVVSQGISGRLAERAAIYVPMSFPLNVALGRQPVYFVLTTKQGSGYLAQDIQGLMAQVANLDAKLLFERAGIWVFRWDPPTGARSHAFAGAQGGVAAWQLQSSVGAPVTDGRPATWRMQGNGQPGNVVWGDYWTEPAGKYQAAVQLAAAGPLTVQVWDPVTSEVLATDDLIGTGQRQQVEVPFAVDASKVVGQGSRLVGKGPMKFLPPAGGPGQLLEVRVISRARTIVSVYTVSVRSAG
jgi:hypothetical protein